MIYFSISSSCTIQHVTLINLQTKDWTKPSFDITVDPSRRQHHQLREMIPETNLGKESETMTKKSEGLRDDRGNLELLKILSDS